MFHSASYKEVITFLCLLRLLYHNFFSQTVPPNKAESSCHVPPNMSLCPQRPHGQLTDGKAGPSTDAHLLSCMSLPRQNTRCRHGIKQICGIHKTKSYMTKIFKNKNQFNQQKFTSTQLSCVIRQHGKYYSTDNATHKVQEAARN